MRRRNFLGITLPLAMAGTGAAEPSERPELSFGLIADPQYADADPKWGRHFRNSLVKLEAAVADLNTRPLDFTVTLGDLIDRDFAGFSAVMPLYAKLAAPHHPVPGNHDFEVADASKPRVLEAMGLAKPWGSKVCGRWRLLFLDGTDIAVWRHPAEDPRTAAARAMLDRLAALGLPQAKEWNAAIGAEQVEWISAELDAAKAAGQRVILFCHYPVFPASDPHNLWNAGEITALLGRHDHVAAWFNGHNHAGNYGKHRSCHFVNLKGMVETAKDSAWAVARCFNDRIEIEGMGLEPGRILAQG